MQTEITLHGSQGEIEFEIDTNYCSVDCARLRWSRPAHHVEISFISGDSLAFLKYMRNILTEEIKLLEIRTTGRVTTDDQA